LVFPQFQFFAGCRWHGLLYGYPENQPVIPKIQLLETKVSINS